MITVEEAFEAGSFGAAAAAVAVAYYAVWAGYRNQTRASDREQRREHYARFLVGADAVIDDFEALDTQIKSIVKSVSETIAAKADNSPTKGPIPKDFRELFQKLVTLLDTWTEAALGGFAIDSERLMDELHELGMPENQGFAIDFVISAIRSIGAHGREVHLSVKILSLSDTPQGVRDAINGFVAMLEDRLTKLGSNPMEVSSWEELRKKLEGVHELMKEDILP